MCHPLYRRDASARACPDGTRFRTGTRQGVRAICLSLAVAMAFLATSAGCQAGDTWKDNWFTEIFAPLPDDPELDHLRRQVSYLKEERDRQAALPAADPGMIDNLDRQIELLVDRIKQRKKQLRGKVEQEPPASYASNKSGVPDS